MKRIQLFEFEDFDWVPVWIRASMTNLIVVLHKITGTKDVLKNLLLSLRKEIPFNKIVDMGSGSGGIMPDVLQSINSELEVPVDLLLTDFHPNSEFIDYIETQGWKHMEYLKESLDATNLSNAPDGLKTMINSFHHMPPESAKKILWTAQDNKQPILIYEMSENNIPLIIWWFLLPVSLVILFIMVLFQTPFSKPLTIKQLIFTYLIPIIPILYAWDGQASLPRMYTKNDVEELLADFKNDSYTWTIAQAKKPNGKKMGYYILGKPV